MKMKIKRNERRSTNSESSNNSELSREESSSDSNAENDYELWRSEVYDKYNSIKKRSLVRSIDLLKSIVKPKKYSHVNECKRNVESMDIMWGSSTYILRQIRLCMLTHNWNMLVHLVKLLTNHNSTYSNKVKEITFQLALIASTQNPDILEELELCFTNTSTKNRFDVSYVKEVKENE